MSDKLDNKLKKDSSTDNSEAKGIQARDDAELEGVAGGWPNEKITPKPGSDPFAK